MFIWPETPFLSNSMLFICAQYLFNPVRFPTQTGLSPTKIANSCEPALSLAHDPASKWITNIPCARLFLKKGLAKYISGPNSES